jgi:protease-4
MRYAHILAKLRSEPWFITDAALSSIESVVHSRIPGPGPVGSMPEPENDPATPIDAPKGVAVIRAHGIIGKHLGMMERMCGGLDYDSITTAVAAAAGDPTISAIVLHIHSPGGMAVGAGEAFDQLRAIRAQSGKDLIGFCDSQACSAGYYLLAACDTILATKTAQLGSIGCMLSFTETSGADAAAGRKRYTFKTGTMKDIGTPDRAPTPEEMTALQARADYLGGIFFADMQSARPQIAPEVYEKALSYFGTQAAAVGLVDEFVPDLQSVLLGLVAPAIADPEEPALPAA